MTWSTSRGQISMRRLYCINIWPSLNSDTVQNRTTVWTFEPREN